MFDTKKAVFGLLALIMVFGAAVPGYAADTEATTDNKKEVASSVESATPAKPQAPITIEGDELSFSDLTGQVFVKGNVRVTQNEVKLTTDLLNGNTKESLVWTDSEATMTQPGVNLIGSGGLKYDYKDNTGTLQQASGKVNRQFVTGRNIEMVSTSEIIINDGTMTVCPAEVPDYHVSADKVEIWPGDKMIAYNAKFWIKNTVIYSMGKYQKSLKEGAQSEFPRIGYDSGDGAYISQYLEVPVAGNTSAYADLTYFSSAGFKPAYGLVDREKMYSVGINYGNYQDSDDEWIKKEPEFRFDLHRQRVGNSPITYTFMGIYGKWTDARKTSWHQDYRLNFRHDTIDLSDTLKLNVGFGLRHLRESYNDYSADSWSAGARLTKTWSPKLTTWTGYGYTQKTSNVFDFDEEDVNKKWTNGVSYKFDHQNTIVFSQVYDLENKLVYDQDYTWRRNLHCWDLEITYREKRDQLKVSIDTVKW
ncbi:MAG: LptA/OstA family protein [Negativicutes bacterium]|nr:LptA/OstA family protein [Negativicutes bacterium]